jgi:hypothetical protein
MKPKDISLCFPDNEKSCFACCPPIRAPGYEHIQHRSIVERILRENSAGFGGDGNRVVPIIGFSCWALGYIDREYDRVGCLLHPAQNRGLDLRYRIDYGEKCRRETCPEAEVFSELGPREKGFWLHLADGLDAFYYSSKEMNPLFNMMGWGTRLLHLIPSKEAYRAFTRDSFFKSYPFFVTPVLPKANAYLINRLLSRENTYLLTRESFRAKFEIFSAHISELLGRESSDASGDPYVHQLGLGRDFSDLLRLSGPIHRMRGEDASILKKRVDEELEAFRRSLN